MAAKTVADKLLCKPGTKVWVSHPEHEALLELPGDAERVERPGAAGVAVVFAADAAALKETLEAHRDEVAAPPVLWIAYPKANRTDINRDTLWPIVTAYGVRPNGQVAIDEVWSALRFRPLKDGEAPFTAGK